jgi:type II secretory pathway component GspD/PulD (secretin)
MKILCAATARARSTKRKYAWTLAGMYLALTVVAAGASPRIQSAEDKSDATKDNSEHYQTIYLTNITQDKDLQDVLTDVRSMVKTARVYYVQSQGALSIHGTAEEIAMAQRIVTDLDKVKKVYRLTYTITELDGSRRLDTKHYSLIVASGGRTTYKLGSKVPIVTGYFDEGKSVANSQVQYQDVGLSIEASLDGYLDGVRVRTKVEQSSVADEKSGVGPQDPIVRQNVLEGTSTLTQGKPLLLGSLDMPGGTRRLEIEVVSELAR